MGVFYVTREDVKAALDVAETARNNKRIDQCIDQSSRAVEGLLHRRFYPEVATRYFDWPSRQYARPWRLWLESNELISVTTFTAGGTSIPSTDYFLRRADGLDEPPYDHIEIDLSSSASFASGSTHQRAIEIEGLWNYDDRTSPAGALAEDLDDSETAVDVTDSSLVGVGHIVKVDSERMIVTGKSMLDTGQNLGGNLTANKGDVTVPVTTGSAYAVDEIILIDSERMLIVDIAGNNLTVKRAWDGSVLDTHNTGADIYAPRTLVVERGALGTSAAVHSTSTAVTRQVFPALVSELTLAYTLTALGQGQASYNRTIGSGDNVRESAGRSLAQIKDDAYTAYGRKMRMGAV